MKRLPGYTLLKSGRWQTPNGGTITEAQYANHVARYQGYRDYQGFLRASERKDYSHFAEIERKRSYGIYVKQYEVDSDFARVYAKAYNERFDKDANGGFAELLVYLGLRDEEWDWDVGETGEV